MPHARHHVARRASLLVLAALTVAPAALAAQYFGRNKVQYDDFDFQVIRADHWDIHYYPEEEEAVRDASRMAERWYDRISGLLDHDFRVKKPVILYANHPDFQQTNTTSGFIGEGTGGFTEGLKDRLVMPLTGIYGSSDHVLGHEIVHVFQYDMAGAGVGGPGLTSLLRLPLWVVEGMAEYLSVGRYDPHTAMWLRDALLRNDLPDLGRLTTDPNFFPYRFGQAFWAWVGGTYGDEAVGRIYRASLREGPGAAFQKVLGLDAGTLSDMWITSIRRDYLPEISGRELPREVGRRVLAADLDAGEMNVGPVLSPDGSRVAFLSEIDLFSISIFVADAETGRVIKRIASSDTDQHIDALSFLESTGTWSPDGSQFAFVVIADGDHQLAVADVERGSFERRITVPGVTAMRDPAWSPDGRHIAVTGVEGGISDLYVIDVETGEARQITDDRFADIHAAWSPDGRTIAFVSDRGPQTDFQRLAYGNMRLAFADVESGDVTMLELFEQAKHINPQYSPDGSELYFISDRGGFSDIYRYEFGTQKVFQVTRIATGVSGITALAPALTVAPRNGRVMFSVFEDGGYQVNALEGDATRGVEVDPAAPAPTRAGLLPPMDAEGSGVIDLYLNDPEFGLPETPDDFPLDQYNSGLALDYVGSSGVGVGVDRFGTGLAGAAAGFFSDLLGNHQMAVAIQANGGVKDVGGQAQYLNRSNRWVWGGGLSHIPFLTSFGTTFVQGVDGNNDGVPDLNGSTFSQLLLRVFSDQVSLVTQYPFSVTNRLEFGVGYSRLAYDFEVREIGAAGSTIIFDRTRSVEPEEIGLESFPTALNTVEASAAYVGDYSFFGFTSPIRGGRYRIEAGATTGDVSFATGLIDYRRYFFDNPVTFAVRGLTFGRYGGDANSSQLQSLNVGTETLVRGYAVESFDPDLECTDTAVSFCEEFDALHGSKIVVGNVEARLALFGVEQLGLIAASFLPTELFLFADGGYAWTGDLSPDVDDPLNDNPFFRNLVDVDREPVFSIGAGTRVNLFGFFIGEVYYALPFQRPEKGGHFGFVLSPGW
ncbi:MAG: peptidase S9 [Gemmatimonadota bacterium]